MADGIARCPTCRQPVPPDASTCPNCGTGLPGAQALPPPAQPAPAAVRADRAPIRNPEAKLAPDLARRFSKLAQWAEAAQPLGITLPVLPHWAEEAARRSHDAERWSDVLRGIERLAQTKTLAALEDWQRDVRTRITRLEAYTVDSRLERDQIEDTLHAAKTGDISRALAEYQQVDRVISLKERHLDTAREDLEAVIALHRDMVALGFPRAEDPEQLATELEEELRSGRLASLKQQLRALRLQALNDLRQALPDFVGQYGNFLKTEKARGIPVAAEIAELGRGARLFAQGKVEEALHRLRKLLQLHGTGTFRPPRVPLAPDDGAGTTREPSPGT